MMNSSINFTVMAVASVFAAIPHTMVYAVERLYDNTHVRLGEGERLLNPEALELLAQPFRTDERNTTITSVSVPMFRVGAPSGELRLSIWDDNSGSPGQAVAEVGSIADIGSLPFGESDQEVLEIATFDRVISGMAPDTTYYLVLDHSVLNTTPPIGDNLGIGAPRSAIGTNGAGSLLALAPGDAFGDEWFNLIEPLGEHRYLQMSVTAVPEPGGALLAGICMLALLLDRRRPPARMFSMFSNTQADSGSAGSI